VARRDQERPAAEPKSAPDDGAIFSQLNVREHDDGASFELRVQPRASRAAVLGVHAGALKISLTAAPVDGAANDALLRLLADRLDVPRASLRLLRGERSRQKVVHVHGLSCASVLARLAASAV
jgi:uncharacterized protein (TIGR00251 family)